jgi:hypothetical protein
MFRCHPLPNPSYLLLVIFVLATSGRGASLCGQDQSDALLRLRASFRFNTTSPNCMWSPSEEIIVLSSWKVHTDCCNWERVTCDSTSGYVTALDLSDLCISGNLSSSDIFKLTSLRSLDLTYNNFDGSPWPTPGLEQLTDLERLLLAYSGLSGNVPAEKGQLSNLVTLDLSGLDLKYFNLEILIDNLVGLQNLYLDQVNISVSPTDLARTSSTNNTTGLKDLSIGSWTITGGHFDTVLTLLLHPKLANLVTLTLDNLDLENSTLHTLIENLGNLQELYLGNVNISVGPTGLAHASSTNLQKLYLKNVNISISPTDLAYPASTNTRSGLKLLSMYWCTITGGRVDTALTKLPFLSNLVTLDLSDFDLKNLSLHALIDNLGSLQQLYLNSVDISVSPIGLVHASSTNMMPSLKELSMTWCTITGRIDIALNKFRFLSKLTLDGTHFSGPAPVPERFVEFSSLTVLSLQSCGLTWTTFPSWIFRIKSLVSLDVSGNENLCGEFPEFIQGSALQVLILRGTKFSGKIPESIVNLKNLTMLDISNCQFHGPIPPFAQWPKIQEVHLSNNNLNGSLPSDGYISLHNLTKVTLRNNSISGLVPASLFSPPFLKYLDLSQNNFTGNFLLDPTVSSSLRTIDLSFNKLQGSLPKLVSKFVELERLDVSSNNLTGLVDLSFINNCKKLYYLSLSYNKFSVVEEDVNHSYLEYPVISELGLASCNLSSVPKILMH